MHISKNSATQIVEEISKLVKQNINLMDETGHIIASRDKSRIGDFHYGAYKIISENLEEYYIDEDDLSKGIKKGINLPLELDGGIVGVIGMTGGYEEVITSGKLLKKMTEILLMESRANYTGLVYAKFIGKRVKSADEVTDNGEVTKTYEELVAEYGKLPNGFNALAPILVPIILMALGSISSMAGWTGALDIACQFLGKPIIALAVGTIFAVIQLATAHKMSDFYNITNETLKTVGPILFVTAAGGVLGKVISSSSMVAFITQHAEVLSAVGIFFPFLLAAILKTAQGSSTVAITTTAGIIAPLLGALGLASPVKTVLCVMAIGAGAMTVSHANDSYFWVVTNFGDMDPEQGYKTQTVCTLIMGIAAMVEIFILSLIL